MRFEEAYAGWQEGRLRQDEAARLLGVCERSFRRYIDRYEEEGLQGLIDHRVGQVSQRRAPVDEVMALTGVDGTPRGVECQALLPMVSARGREAQLYLGEV